MSADESTSLYSILGVSAGASEVEVSPCCWINRKVVMIIAAGELTVGCAAQIRRAYRNLATKQHPDKGGDPGQFTRIQQAYSLLSNPDKVSS
jgi:curved DNA-binding protein CbpA